MKRKIIFQAIAVIVVLAAIIALWFAFKNNSNTPRPITDYVIYLVPTNNTAILVININHTPETATLQGMEKTFRGINDKLIAAGKLPDKTTLNVLLAQPGLGGSAFSERRLFARTAYKSGKDLVISIDMTDKFKWPWESGDLRMFQIDEDITRRFERLAVAARHVWKRPPDAILESQSTRFLIKGNNGSITLPDLFEKGKLHKDFKLGKIVCVGAPLRGMKIDTSFKNECLGEVLAITTPSKTGLIASEPIKGASAVEVKLSNGKRVRHKMLFREKWPDKQANPIPDLSAMFLNGEPIDKIQAEADRRQR
ncbi:MAG: hypothetical protein Q7N50_07390 [Armatimonadota bacterium]|nr:hypothetical protein [Armatimonadota bacterium]